MSNNPAPFPKRPNPLTDAMDAVQGVNQQMGSPVGVRAQPVHTSGYDTPTGMPLTDEEKRARELEYLAHTGEIIPDSILAKEDYVPEVSASVKLGTWTPPSMRIPQVAISLMQPIDFSDIHSIDFKNKTIVVAGTTLPLTNYYYEQLAVMAASALCSSITEASRGALDKLLPARSTDGEKMPEVRVGETTEGIQ